MLVQCLRFWVFDKTIRNIKKRKGTDFGREEFIQNFHAHLIGVLAQNLRPEDALQMLAEHSKKLVLYIICVRINKLGYYK